MAGSSWSIQEPDFEANARLASVPELHLTGSADTRVEKPLLELITSLHDSVCASHARHVDVDMRGLEFMNASCFNVFVSWVGLINELEPEQRYQLRFTTNTANPWQRRSLRTLSFFATDLVVFT